MATAGAMLGTLCGESNSSASGTATTLHRKYMNSSMLWNTRNAPTTMFSARREPWNCTRAAIFPRSLYVWMHGNSTNNERHEASADEDRVAHPPCARDHIREQQHCSILMLTSRWILWVLCLSFLNTNEPNK